MKSALLMLSAILLLSGCGNLPEPDQEQQPRPPATVQQSIDTLLEQAASSRQPAASELLLQAIELMLETGDFRRARDYIARIDPATQLDDGLDTRALLVRAELALEADDPAVASTLLSEPLIEELSEQDSDLFSRSLALRARAYMAMEQPFAATLALIRLSAFRQPDTDPATQNLIWQNLQRLDDRQLGELAGAAATYEMRGWVELSQALRREAYSLPAQMEALRRWKAVWNRHSASGLPPTALANLEDVWRLRPQHVALLLPLRDQIGIAVQEGFLAAYYDALSDGDPIPRISVFDTTGINEIGGIYERVVASGADLIIGPLNKDLVRQLDNLSSLPVKTLALNYTDFDGRNSANLFQFGLAPEDEIRAITQLAWTAGHRNAAIVAPAGADYQRLEQEFDSSWTERGGAIVARATYASETELAQTVKLLLAIDASETRASRIASLLPRETVEFTPRRRGDIDFVFLVANPRQGRQIKPTLAFYFAGDLPVYALPAIYDGSDNPMANQDLNGVVFIDTPWLLRGDDPLKQRVAGALRTAQGPLQRLRALGIDSFRIYSRLDQLANGDVANFPGVTGLLSMDDLGIIRRIPQSALFVEGVATPLETELVTVAD